MLAFRRFARVFCAACAVAGFIGWSAPARAQVPLINGFGGPVGYGTQCLSPNDDGSGPAVDLTAAFPQGLHFFTNVHTSAYVNTNGNITFSGPLPTYTPNPFPVANQPMIAPYWADEDIRLVNGVCQGSAGLTCMVCQPCHNPLENGVWWYLEPGRMVVTWDTNGYFSCHNDLRMSFQLILTAAGCGLAGDFDVEFRFNRCEWETGDASGGTNGFGGTQAQAGFDAGNLADFVAIPGSLAPGISTIMCTQSNVGEPGIWRFQIRSGTVVCPDAGQPCSTGGLGVCGSGHTNCVGSGTECVQDLQPEAEKCDALDNDCDGQVDDPDSSLCEPGLFCASGTCVLPCSELGCGEGEICDVSGLCIDQACVGITCDVGMRCVNGICVGACDGVICPFGQVCLSGRCVDPCVSQDCDSCTVCKEGLCVSRCEYTPCPSGETCQADGRCLEDACLNVTCDPGFHCAGGTCVDSCTGAVCPTGQNCEQGLCIQHGTEPPQPDAGFGGFGASSPWDDSGTGATGTGAAPTSDDFGERDTYGGCGCRSAGDGRTPWGVALGIALAALARVRRSRRSRDAA